MRRLSAVLILVSILCLLSSCATINSSKTVSGVHPANVDLNGAKTITVMPFTVDSKAQLSGQTGAAEAQTAADYIRECLIAELEKSKNLKYKTSGADVAISGRITKYIVETEKTGTGSGFIRSVVAAVEYDIQNTKSSTILAKNNTSISAESKAYAAEKRLPAAYTLIEPKLPRISTVILQDVQPYTIVNRISLIKVKRNRAMRRAYKLFAEGRYSDSMQSYLEIYKNTNLFEAGYNAARLMQIKGDLESAKKLSTELFTKFKDTRAANVLHEIENQQKFVKTE
ncbi:MAG: hypothetical protein IKZ86_05330 [Spirochaetaceae bacterium]|nr:hypothetical protein [Spirochaetaceae bacterium]